MTVVYWYRTDKPHNIIVITDNNLNNNISYHSIFNYYIRVEFGLPFAPKIKDYTSWSALEFVTYFC